MKIPLIAGIIFSIASCSKNTHKLSFQATIGNQDPVKAGAKDITLLHLLITNDSQDSIFVRSTDIRHGLFYRSDFGLEKIDELDYLFSEKLQSLQPSFPNTPGKEYLGHSTVLDSSQIEEYLDRFLVPNIGDSLLFFKESLIQASIKGLYFFPPGARLNLRYDLSSIKELRQYPLIIRFGYIPQGLDFSGLDYQFILPEEIAGYRYYSDTIPMRELEVDLPVLR